MTQEDQSSSLLKRDFCKIARFSKQNRKKQIQTEHPIKFEYQIKDVF